MRPGPLGQGRAPVSGAETSSQGHLRDGEPKQAATREIVHLGTGEVLGALEAQPPDLLAEVALLLAEREAELKAMRQLIEAELRDRMAQRHRRRWAVGDFEVEVDSGNRSVWDGDELEAVLRDLVDRGVIDAREAVGIVEHKTVVHGREANSLKGRLSGAAADAVERCRQWERRTGSVRIVRALPLLPEQD